MAAFPTLSGGRSYQLPFDEQPAEQRVESEAADGTFRTRIATPIASVAANYVFEYPYITKSDWSSVMTFYAANAAIPFDFELHDGLSAATVQMVFRRKPRRQVRGGESLAMTLELRRVL